MGGNWPWRSRVKYQNCDIKIYHDDDDDGCDEDYDIDVKLNDRIDEGHKLGQYSGFIRNIKLSFL